MRCPYDPQTGVSKAYRDVIKGWLTLQSDVHNAVACKRNKHIAKLRLS